MSEIVTFEAQFGTNDQSIFGGDIGDEIIAFDTEFGVSNQSIFGDETSIETGDYNMLENLPLINGIIIRGSRTSNDYKLQDQMMAITASEIDNIIFGEGEI